MPETRSSSPSIPVWRWATASAADAPDTSPMELTALGRHIDRCNDSRGKWFRFRCAAESITGFLAPRLVTTFVAVTLLFGIASLIA